MISVVIYFTLIAIPPNPLNRDANYWIERTYDELYGSDEPPLQRLLDKQKDKSTYHNTTSNKFKQDLVDFFGDNFKDKDIYEVGADAGLTTRVLSFLFNKVFVNNNWNPNQYDINNDWIVKKEIKHKNTTWYKKYSVDIRNEINHEFENVTYIEMDSYNKKGWPKKLLKDVSVVFIDCIHNYEAVSLDIKNALKLKPEYIVFDDYGLSTMGGVKRAVDDFIDNEKLELVKEIGLQKGTYGATDRTKPMVFNDSEGVICKVK